MDLATQVSKKYFGDLLRSQLDQEGVSVEVERLNDLLVKVTFDVDGQNWIFRAMLSASQEGVLMTIQDRVTKHHILSGKSGFLYKKVNIHGGYLKKLGSFYFNLNIEEFNGQRDEMFFLGRGSQPAGACVEDARYEQSEARSF